MEITRWSVEYPQADCDGLCFDNPFEGLGRVLVEHSPANNLMLIELRQCTKDGQPCYQLMNGYGGLIANVYQKCDVVEGA